ncbi:MmpS family transport accessory protein [Actinoplanes sp. NPDC026619]|uniref:MmpS family transport accessory protein n=1 Tax=Actinoplanes sp. NPDC026619 TaxID=3155798 RepID=UPI0033D81516
MRRSVVALAAVLFTAACSGGGSPVPQPSASPSPNTFKLQDAPIPVQLEVSGSGTAEISYGPPAARITATLPWSQTVDAPQSDLVLGTTLTARSTSTGAKATITCRISLGGATIEEKTAHGPLAVADCAPRAALINPGGTEPTPGG